MNLYPKIACVVCKNGNRKLYTIASCAMTKFGIEYQGFLLRFGTHKNEFKCVFRSKQLHKYMGESSNFPKNLNFRDSKFKTCRMPTKLNDFKFK